MSALMVVVVVVLLLMLLLFVFAERLVVGFGFPLCPLAEGVHRVRSPRGVAPRMRRGPQLMTAAYVGIDPVGAASGER